MYVANAGRGLKSTSIYRGSIGSLEGPYRENIKMYMFAFFDILTEIFKVDFFQNGDGAFCFTHESNPILTEYNPKNLHFHDLSDYWKCHRPLGALIFDFGSAELP